MPAPGVVQTIFPNMIHICIRALKLIISMSSLKKPLLLVTLFTPNIEQWGGAIFQNKFSTSLCLTWSTY